MRRSALGGLALCTGLILLYASSWSSHEEQADALVQEGVFTPGVQVNIPQMYAQPQQPVFQSMADVAIGTNGAGSNGM